jgi:condensin complex subunit 2
LNKSDESRWTKASASLDASAKIYGYRVDCVHSDTFRFLGGLNRTDRDEDKDKALNGNDNEENSEEIKKVKIQVLKIVLL